MIPIVVQHLRPRLGEIEGHGPLVGDHVQNVYSVTLLDGRRGGAVRQVSGSREELIAKMNLCGKIELIALKSARLARMKARQRFWRNTSRFERLQNRRHLARIARGKHPIANIHDAVADVAFWVRG